MQHHHHGQTVRYIFRFLVVLGQTSTSALAWLTTNLASMPGINFSKQTAIDNQQTRPTLRESMPYYLELELAGENVRIRESDKNIECFASRADAGPTIPGPLAVWWRSRAKIRPSKVRQTHRFKLIQQCFTLSPSHFFDEDDSHFQILRWQSRNRNDWKMMD